LRLRAHECKPDRRAVRRITGRSKSAQPSLWSMRAPHTMERVVCALALGSVAVANVDLMVRSDSHRGRPGAQSELHVHRPMRYGAVHPARVYDHAAGRRIAVVCIEYGYLVGVGGASYAPARVFAVNYARLGAVQRHVTRAQFKSYVDARRKRRSICARPARPFISTGSRATSSSAPPKACSSESAPTSRGHRPSVSSTWSWIFGMVSGVDTSAVMSLAKAAAHLCSRQGIVLVYCSLSPPIRAPTRRLSPSPWRSH